jgi:hypothetical protein
MSKGWAAAMVAAALCASGCGMDARHEAASDVRALLAAAQAGDTAAFEAHIDRPSLQADLKSQLMTLPEIRALQSQLGDNVGDVAAERMISPQAVVQARAGVGPLRDDKDVVQALRVLDHTRVCLSEPKEKDRCALTFEKKGRAWKLTAIHATDLRAQIPEGW